MTEFCILEKPILVWSAFVTTCTIIALAVQNGLKLHQMDVTTAFLNGKLKEEVYMQQPEGFVIKGQEHLVGKLKRSIYGLKQSSRCWNSVLEKAEEDAFCTNI